MLPEEKGLTSSEAKKRLEKYGPNTLPETPPPSDILTLLYQFKNPLVYVLLAAGITTFFLGHTSDTIIITLAVLINTILGFVQERRAGKALYALKKLLHPTAKVVRDGKLATIDVNEIVPGDVAILEQGSKIPGDGKLVGANRLFVSEAMLTGESVAVSKAKGDKIFMGTIVTSGRGEALIESTGKTTEIGKIAKGVQAPDEDTPLRKQLSAFSRQLSVLVLILVVAVFVIGLILGKDMVEIFTTSVALAVSAIPEGLLVALTVVLAIGMQRILKRKGLVRNLVSAETLGGVTTICVDKTGTLTEGSLQVVDVLGDERDIATQAVLANDLDDPIVITAWDWATKRLTNHQSLITNHKRLDSIPFSPETRFFASLHKWDSKKNVVYVNGAPEFLLGWASLSKKEKSEIEKKIEGFTMKGERVVGLARKKVSVKKTSLAKSDVKGSLEWVGILAFSDPVRPGVKAALEKTRQAGIDLIVITGDYPQTAVSVMNKLGIDIGEKGVVLGDDLKKMSSKQLALRLSDDSQTILFARTTPEQKHKIVSALKENGEVVAMMGDGVNDAPALRKADIGIVVGEATDVAKETADLVLLDSNFATIIAAIEEGRGIFDNIRKIILYLMSDAFEEIIAVVGSIILGATLLPGLPLPVTAAQVLWINLISDGFPDLALTVDPKASGIMKRTPRPTSEGLMASWMKRLIFIVSLAGGIMALALFIIFYLRTGDAALSRSIAFATLGVNSLIYVFSVKTLTEPFWKENPFANKWLNFAVIIGFVFQIAPFGFEPTRRFLGLTTLSIAQWALVFLASAVMFIIIESVKPIFHK